MDRTEKVILTNMCMIEDGTRVVCQERHDYRSGICFPGGHVEKNEPFVKSVIREVYEETGLTISSPVLCGIKDWITKDGVRYIVLLYKADKFTGKLRSSDEGRVFMAEKSELMSMKLSDSMDKILKVYFDEKLSEVYAQNIDGIWQYTFK